MAEFPSRGTLNWDNLLRDYIDDVVDEAAYSAAGGVELGSVERTAAFTTTNTVSTSSAGDIPTFSITVEGEGRPIDLRLFAPQAYHSVAGTLVHGMVYDTAAAVTARVNNLGGVSSPVTNAGPSLLVEHRTPVLTLSQSYTFAARIWGAAAGTCTLVGASFAPIQFTATSR